jgi:hypothetical protein
MDDDACEAPEPGAVDRLQPLAGGAANVALPGSIGRLRPLNTPTPVRVQLGRDRTPKKVALRGRSRMVATVQERWRIDEGWWWERSVSRTYWRLVLDDGRQIIVYEDENDHTWWAQRA